MTSHRTTGPAEPVAAGAKKSRCRGLALALLAGAAGLGGCVSVSAPEEPIVIELNVNIRQEVVYRLAADAGTTIQQNPEIF